MNPFHPIKYLQNNAFLYLIILPLLFILSCQTETTEPIDKETLIAIEVSKRIKEFEKGVLKRCQENVLKDATLRVDSILIARAKAQRDTTSKPPKPFKPERPEIAVVEDTSAIVPLLPFEEEQDTTVIPDSTLLDKNEKDIQ